MNMLLPLHRIALLLTLTLLAGCATTSVRPDVSKNYSLQQVRSGQTAIESYWMSQGESAIKAHWQEHERLKTSDDPKVQAWREGLDSLKGKPPLEQLAHLNMQINHAVPYLGDYEQWSRMDRWGHSINTLTVGGDCEDYAILKAASLLYMGWPPDRLYVLIGFSGITQPPGSHAILMVVMEDGAQVLLDSATDGLSTPAENHDYSPDYAVTRLALYRIPPLPGHKAPQQISHRIARPRRMGMPLPDAAEQEHAAALMFAPTAGAVPQKPAP